MNLFSYMLEIFSNLKQALHIGEDYTFDAKILVEMISHISIDLRWKTEAVFGNILFHSVFQFLFSSKFDDQIFISFYNNCMIEIMKLINENSL